jgi:hypothetical protein
VEVPGLGRERTTWAFFLLDEADGEEGNDERSAFADSRGLAAFNFSSEAWLWLWLWLFLVTEELFFVVELAASGRPVRILVGDMANLEEWEEEEEEAGTDEEDAVVVVLPGFLSPSPSSSATDDTATTTTAAEEEGAELDSVILGKFIPGLAWVKS